MLQMMEEYFRPIEVSPATMALEAIAEVGPGGHFFGAAHTMERYETAFYSPILSNWDNHPQWLERGGVQARERANAVWKQMLAEYEQPPLDSGIAEALKDFVARRRAEGGAPMN